MYPRVMVSDDLPASPHIEAVDLHQLIAPPRGTARDLFRKFRPDNAIIGVPAQSLDGFPPLIVPRS